ncbi:MAG: UDP-N-acetylmuramoyl-L-alanine--D-glutamate ligase [Bacillota bacterium]|nr:UDP-N-acetylmuramoyl-L-alanine--D-glutamate ligase [Bacillota bacterium]
MRVDIKEEWNGKRVAVVGLGISNLALIRFLTVAGAQISGRDQKTEEQLEREIKELRSLGVELILGQDYLRDLNKYDVVMVSPGVPKSLPQIKEVKRLGKLNSEIGLVFAHSQAPIYGITGSSGKTTTTTLVGEMLKLSHVPVYVGGNIGKPLITQLNNFIPQDRIVLELSSFQLEDLSKSPHGALVTNIAENHLDIHGTMENYVESKKNIYLHQKAHDFVVLNNDDPLTRSMGEEVRGKVFYFSLEGKVQNGAYLSGDDLIYVDDFGETIFGNGSKLALPGRHNIANFLAAAIFSRQAGATWDAIKEVGENFGGVAHRLEFVAELDGVKYYNDSIATTPDRTLAALNSFNEPIILIAGGSDKDLSYGVLAEGIHKCVKHLILLGATASKIKSEVLNMGDFPLEQVNDLQEAVILANQLANPGEIVLLSPASASYDQYKNFMQRGEHFRGLVQGL